MLLQVDAMPCINTKYYTLNLYNNLIISKQTIIFMCMYAWHPCVFMCMSICVNAHVDISAYVQVW